jgi:WD40 repeat protein
MPSKYERKIQAHGGQQVNLDWHPEEKNWIATGSLDKAIKVWDLSPIVSERPSSLSPLYMLSHSEQVSSIKWRPNRKTQITACSTATDAHLYVWDFKRPYVPYASFDSLTNKVKSEYSIYYRWNYNVTVHLSQLI